MKLEDHNKRIALARKSLDGLSLGDAFGQRFFGNSESAARRIAARSFPTGILRYTDDTVMALSIVDVLNQFGYIEQNELAKPTFRTLGTEYRATQSGGGLKHGVRQPHEIKNLPVEGAELWLEELDLTPRLE